MVRTALMWVASLALAAPASAQWTLAWSDEFDGPSLDTGVWEHMLGSGTAYGLPAGWGNNELQIYTSDSANSYVQNGSLHLVAVKTGGSSYTSARLRTQGNLDILYGRIEARMKIPSGQGMWPAFWMLPTGSPYGGWASSGEIDIMESTGIADRVYGTIHFGDYWPNNASNGGSYAGGNDYGSTFHTMAIEWEPDQMRWYMDNVMYHSVNSSQWYSVAAPGNSRAPFDTPFHLLLNVAVGGDWPGYPDGSTVFPQTLEVDYVRVYTAGSGSSTELQNAGFESGGSPFASWGTFGNVLPNIHQVQLFPFAGASHAKMYGQFVGGANDCGVYQSVDAAPGEVWTATVQAAHEGFDAIQGTNRGFMSLLFHDALGNQLADHPIDTLDASSPTDVYQPFSVTATAPPGTASAQIVLGFYQSATNPRAGAIYYDAATLTAAPAACSPADLTTQGAGAGDPGYGEPDGQVTAADLNYFVNAWVSGGLAIADVTTQGAGLGDPEFGVPDGSVTAADLNYYVNLWVPGCP